MEQDNNYTSKESWNATCAFSSSKEKISRQRMLHLTARPRNTTLLSRIRHVQSIVLNFSGMILLLLYHCSLLSFIQKLKAEEPALFYGKALHYTSRNQGQVSSSRTNKNADAPPPDTYINSSGRG